MRLSPLQLKPSPSPTLSLFLGTLLLLLAGLSARAQFLTAEDFFHSGAQFFISNNIPLAKERVKSGLQIYPKDDKLQKLQQLLDQQQNQNSQSQSQDQQPPDQQKSQSDQKNQQQQQQQQPQPSKSDQEKQKEQEQQAQKAAEQKKDQDQPDKSEAQKAAEAAAKQGSETNDLADAKGTHPMTPQEAERLLNARKGSEQYLAQKPNAKPPNSRHPVKDW